MITLADKPLADKVSGTIQNLGVAGSSTLTLSDGQGRRVFSTYGLRKAGMGERAAACAGVGGEELTDDI